jgi:hypothetical protein
MFTWRGFPVLVPTLLLTTRMSFDALTLALATAIVVGAAFFLVSQISRLL